MAGGLPCDIVAAFQLYAVVQSQRSQIAEYVPKSCGTLRSIAIYSFTECMFLVHAGGKKKKTGKKPKSKADKMHAHCTHIHKA